jgi:hypothetical protein
MAASAATNMYAKAKYEATQLLIANHTDEYEAVLKAAKLKYGITPRLNRAERIALLEQTLAELKGSN